MRIIGIDPGTAITGYGVIDFINNRFLLERFGTIKTKASENLHNRLQTIYSGINTVIKESKPDSFAIESIFYSENVKTSLTLAHTRGVLLLAGVGNGLNIDEYSPRKVKQSVVGYGNASKEQVQYMTKTLLGLREIPKPNDAADGCAIAICHINNMKLHKKLQYLK